MSGLYIHIPFCASRCIYCGFYSTTRPQLRDRYVEALCREMRLRRDYLPESERTIRTIYIGGGTPSQLSPIQIERIFETIGQTFDVQSEETTVEVNPDDVTPALAEVLRRCGADRVSMGAQTFDDERLRFLHRRHRPNDVVSAVKTLRCAGITNISIDLMFGFPGETADDWSRDIDQALALEVPHISAYSLMYEEGTLLHSLLDRGKVAAIDEDLSLHMYNMLIDRLTEGGYEHYEISNFARPGMRARHNASYWTDVPYIGVGAAAHSYNRSSRQWNVSDIDRYIESIAMEHIPMEREVIDERTHYDDLVTTALRTADGLDLSLLTATQRDFILSSAKPHLATGKVRYDGHRLRLTRKGLYVSDLIMSDLMMI